MANTTQASTEERIRQRAYRLWQEDGSPEGNADEYWYRALKQITAEGDDTEGNGAYPEPSLEQSDKQQFEAVVPEESPAGDDTTLSEPRAKRRRI